MADIQFGLRLTADGSGFVGTVQVATASVEKLGREARGVAPGLAAMDAEMKKSITSAIALGSTIGILAADMVKGIASWTAEGLRARAALKDWADETGSTVESLSRISNFAKVSGLEIGALRVATEKLSVGLAGTDEESKRAGKALALLGIQSRDPATAILELAKKLDGYSDGVNKAALANEIFGRGGARLLPLLKDMAQQTEAGAIVTRMQAEEAEKLTKSMNALALEAGSLRDIILGGMVPALNEMIERFKLARAAGQGIFRSILTGIDEQGDVVARITSAGAAVAALTAQVAKGQQQGHAGGPLFNSMVLKDAIEQLDAAKIKLGLLIALRDKAITSNTAALGFTGDARDPRQTPKPDAPEVPARATGAAAKEKVQSITSIFGDIEKATELARNGFAMLAQIEKTELDRQLDILQFHHQASLISEQEYIAQRALLQESSARAEVDKAKSTYESLLAQVQAIQAVPTKNADERLAKQAKLEDLQKKLTNEVVAWAAAEDKAGDAARKGGEAAYLAKNKLLDVLDKINLEQADYLKGLAQQVKDQNFELTLIGKTTTQQAQARAERELRKKVEEDILKITREIDKLEKGGGDPAQIALLKQNREDIRVTTEQTVVALKESIEATDDLAESTKRLQNLWGEIDSAVFNFLSKVQTDWKAAFTGLAESFKNTILKEIYEATIKPYVLKIFTQMTSGSGGMGALFGTGGGAGGAGGAGAFSQLFSSEDFTTALGGAATGFAIGSAVGGVGAQAFGTDRNAEGIQMGSTIGAVIGGIIGAFAGVPMVGAAIGSVIGGAAGSMVSSGGGPKTGGFATVGDVSGIRDTDSSTPPRWFTPSGRDAQAQGIADSLEEDYDRLLKDLGGTGAAGRVGFALGFNADPMGTSDSSLHVGSFVGGRQVFNAERSDLGADEAALNDELKLAGKRSLLAALQASDLPALMGRVLATVTAETAKEKDIDRIFEFGKAFRDMLDAINADAIVNAEKEWKNSQRTQIQVMQDMGAELTTLALAYDGSIESTRELAQATTAYRGAIAQMLVTIRQVQQAVGAMFADTKLQFQQVGLSPEELFNFWKGQADAALREISTATDPATIGRLSEQVNRYIQNAFGAVQQPEAAPGQTPEDAAAAWAATQRGLAGSFIDYLTGVDTIVQERLEGIFATVSGPETAAPFTVVQTALESAVAKMEAAAIVQRDAAAAQQRAADTMILAAGRMADLSIMVYQQPAQAPSTVNG